MSMHQFMKLFCLRNQALIPVLLVGKLSYISLVQLQSNDNDTGITYLMEHVMDDMVIPDPTSKTFEIDYSSWRTKWYSKLSNLENLIQLLPKLSENEKKN